MCIFLNYLISLDNLCDYKIILSMELKKNTNKSISWLYSLTSNSTYASLVKSSWEWKMFPMQIFLILKLITWIHHANQQKDAWFKGTLGVLSEFLQEIEFSHSLISQLNLI